MTEAFPIRDPFRRTVVCMTAKAEQTRKVATPWGPASLVEEVELPQAAPDKEFVSVVQLLESPEGERLVRFAYTTGGVARRGPITLRADDVAALRKALRKRPALAEVLAMR